MHSRREGQAALLVSLNLVFIFSVVGLAVDIGYGFLIKNKAQTAADAAANAAAGWAMDHGDVCGANATCGSTYDCLNPPTTPPTNSLQTACLYAKRNGFVNDVTNQQVSVIENNTAPPNLTGNAPAMWIQVRVSQIIHNRFLFMAGYQSGSVASQAVAGVSTTTQSNCIFALGTSGTVYSQTGSSTVSSNCGIYVNANMSKTGSGDITAPTIQYFGTYSKVGSGIVTPAPTHAVSLVADPLATLPKPSFANHCDQINYSTSNPVTLTPGTYCGGIGISGSSTITFNPGTYILNGGGLTVTGSGTLNGAGVMFFVTGQYGQTAGPVSIAGSTTLNFTGPTSGTYRGILFFQDPAVSYGAANSIVGSSTNSSGTYYFPTTELDYAGSSTQVYQSLVASTIRIVGTANLKNDTAGTYTGLARAKATIIE